MYRIILFLLSSALCVGLLPTMARQTAAQNELAALGDVIFEDALVEPRVVTAGACEGGRVLTEFNPEGYMLRVRGKCRPADSRAVLFVWPSDLSLQDGEIRADVKLVSGGNRASFYFTVRSDPRGNSNYYVILTPAGRQVLIGRNDEGQSQGTTLAQKQGPEVPVRPDDWNTFAIRMNGPQMWVLLNDQVVLSLVDPGADGRGIRLNLSRSGNPDDEEEAAVLVRNLRLTALKDGDAARAPSYAPPLAEVPAGKVPPALGAVVLEDSLADGGVMPTRACITGKGGSEAVADGLLIKVRGKCREEDQNVIAQFDVPGLSFADGGVQIDFKFPQGVGRTAFWTYVRAAGPTSSSEAYFLGFQPEQGIAMIGRNSGGVSTVLARRTDLASVTDWANWSTMSIQADGTNLWLMLNGTPLLWAEDAQFTGGNVIMRVARFGDTSDGAEVAVALRNLQVSAVQGSPADRAPAYQTSRVLGPVVAFRNSLDR